MGQNAVGFYWTLPVPWAGFTALPQDIEGATAASQTIRFQRELTHVYARNQGYSLVHEKVFLEIEPDRGSDLVLEPLAQVEQICRARNAVLLFVEFADVQGWRSHAPMYEWSQQTTIDLEPVPAYPLQMDGTLFDPHGHFRSWREHQRNWSSGKAERIQKARARVTTLQGEVLGHQHIAGQLNEEGVRSPSGKPWTGESLRKFVIANDCSKSQEGRRETVIDQANLRTSRKTARTGQGGLAEKTYCGTNPIDAISAD